MGGGVLIIGIFFGAITLVQSEPIRCGSDDDNAFCSVLSVQLTMLQKFINKRRVESGHATRESIV